MAKIVGAFGVPHTPMFPLLHRQQGDEFEAARFFAQIAEPLAACRADVAIMFDTDHLNSFFYDNLPIFAVGVDEGFDGPNEDVPALPNYRVPSMERLAAHIHRSLVHQDFDVSLVQQYDADHSIMVPMHFLTPNMDLPVIPVFISGHVPPLPTARRCLRLGQAVAAAVASWPEDLRVVVMGSGAFSLEVGGPRIDAGSVGGIPSPEWVEEVCALLRAGDVDTLVEKSTPEQFAKAGNISGEILNWIAMLGAYGAEPADQVLPQVDFGHAFATWSSR